MQERAHQIYESEHQFHGASGRKYSYHLPQDLNSIPAVAGNYMFAIRQNQNEDWWVLYVGESENLRNRLVDSRHEKMDECLLFADPYPVYILYDANRWSKGGRRNAEKDLIDSEGPSLNS